MEQGGQRGEPEGSGKSEVKPVTEWAGMTDWVVALRERSPVKRKEDKRWKVASNRVGRNDRLGAGESEKEERKAEEGKIDEVARDRVGRNDRLSQGGSGKTKKPRKEK